MSLLITCSQCGSQLKAPDRLAGRIVRCLKCKAALEIPVAPSLPPGQVHEAETVVVPPPIPASMPVAESSAAEAATRSSAWLTAMLLTGMGVAFFLIIALLVVILNRPATSITAAPEPKPQEPLPETPAPKEQMPAEPKLPPPLPDRAERLAALEIQEKQALADFHQRAELHKDTLQRLRKEEDGLFTGKINPKPAVTAKQRARAEMFLKDQAAALRLIIVDQAALERKREEFLQTKRKLLFDHPETGDPPLEAYGNLILAPQEIKDLVQRDAGGSSPRAVAFPHVQNADTIKTPSYAGTYQHPSDADVVAVAYRGTYRGRADQTAHIYMLRWRGSWLLLELPGRTNSVVFGPPPSDYKRIDAGL